MNLDEVARLAGVSRSTVSRVVNEDRRVSPAVRLRVQELIREHDYHPNAAGRSLASKRTRILGLLVPNSTTAIFTDPYFPLLIQGAVDACNAADHNLMLLMENSSDHVAAEQVYSRVIRGRHLDGVVIASSLVDDPVVAHLLQGAFPYVLVGRHPRQQDVSFVDVLNREAAQEAVTHLLDHGCRRIAMIGGMRNMIASIDRYAGYVTALQQAGLLPDPALVVDGGFSEIGAYRAMQELLPHRPDAVFAASDVMALGALRVLQEQGIQVPDDMAVVGFDGLDLGAVSQPPLTSMFQPIADLGRAAVGVLLERIAHPEAPAIHRLLGTQLLIRRTCGCP
jgi:LacI family transcriptional regulator